MADNIQGWNGITENYLLLYFTSIVRHVFRKASNLVEYYRLT